MMPNDELTQSGDTSLVIENAEGCDSTITLHLTINNSTEGVDVQTVCDSFTWIDDSTYTTTPVDEMPTHVLTNAANCDSIVTLQLTINHSDSSTVEQTACDEYTWDVTGVTHTATIDTTVALTNAVGCDSTIMLHLTINNSSSSDTTAVACDSYFWEMMPNDELTQSGDTTLVIENAVGCDSTITLHLTINNSTEGIDTQTVCDSLTWIDGHTYSSTVVAESPTYTYQNGNAMGCDSVVTLQLTIADNYTASFVSNEVETMQMAEETICALNMLTLPENEYEYTDHVFIGWQNATTGDTLQPGDSLYLTGNTTFNTLWETLCHNIDSVEEAQICEGDSMNWRGQMVDGSQGEYTVTIAGVVDELCDSVYHLILTVNSPSTSDTTIMACDSLTWNGTTYTATPDSGEVSYLIEGGSANGCDSTAYLHLTINYSVHDYVVETACDSYIFNDIEYTESTDLPTIGDTSENGCPFITHISLTVNHSYHGEDSATACDMLVWNDMELTESGDHDFVSYTVDGCDSVITMHLTLNRTTYGVDTLTACDSLTWIDGNTYFSDFTAESGEITYLMQGANQWGCDSVAVLNLTMQERFTVDFSTDYGEGWMEPEQGCSNSPIVVPDCPFSNEGFVFLGWIDPMTGDTIQPGDTIYLFDASSFYAAWGPLCEDVIVFIDSVMCDGDSLIWRGVDYTDQLFSGDYMDVAYEAIENYCDSIYHLRLTVYPISRNEFYDTIVGSYTWHNEVYNTSGDYEVLTGQNKYGCDSIEVLHLIINLSIDDTETLEVNVYPNPTNGIVHIEGNLVKKITVMDAVGRAVGIFEDTNQIDIRDLASGIYTLHIETEQGNTTRRIVKR